MNRERRVFGPPGSGKTTTVARIIGETVDGGYSPNEVMAASFTRAAAQELNKRKLPIPDKNIGTVHAICYRMLNQPELADTPKGLRMFNDEHPSLALSGAAGDLTEGAYQSMDDNDKMFADYQVCRARMEPLPPALLKSKLIAAWEAFKYEHELMDFTDLIETCLKNHIGPPSGVGVGFFDEVQDFTPLELALVRQWGQSLELSYLVGDDDQCIYDFKGASPDAFLTPDIPDEDKIHLDIGYRLPVNVHEYAENWIHRIKGKREDKYARPRADYGSVEKAPITYFDLDKWSSALADESERSTMLLTTCGYMLSPMIKVLRDAGIPFWNPYARQRGDWNPLQSSSASGVTTLDRIRALYHLPWTFYDVRLFSQLVNATGNFKRGALTNYLPKPPGEQVMDDTALAAVFEDNALAEILADPLGWVQRNAKKPKRNQIDFIAHIVERQGWGALNRRPSIIVGTIHSVKGGEADDVILFPDISFKAYVNGALKEDATIRQFYVGMTRARERLYIGQPISIQKGRYVALPAPQKGID